MKTAPLTLTRFIDQVDAVVTTKSMLDYMSRLYAKDNPFGATSHTRSLEAVFSKVQAALPASSILLPSGKRWAGSSMPQGWADARVLLPTSASDPPTQRGSLLHLASMLGVRPKWIGWLLASGVDPLQFHPEVGNAPLGQMAYSGDHASVRVLRRAGIDLALRLDPSHLDMSKPDQRRLAGTTLLHRVVARSRFKNEAARKVVDELLLGGLSPTQESLAGETSIDLCQDPEMRIHLERHVAKSSRRALIGSVAPAISGQGAPGKRF